MATGARRAAAAGAWLVAFVPAFAACGSPMPHAAKAPPSGVVTQVDAQPEPLPATADPPPLPSPPAPERPAVRAASRSRAPARPASAPGSRARPPATDGLFTIEIPRIGLVARVHEGQSAAVLARGPGHQPGSALPGQQGNVVVPGHRTVAPHPFMDIDRIERGDDIVLVDGAQRFVYEVTGSTIVAAEDGGVAEPTPDPIVTIYACHPKGSNRQRYVVFGRLRTAVETSDSSPPSRQQGPAHDDEPSRDPPHTCGLVPCIRGGDEDGTGRRG